MNMPHKETLYRVYAWLVTIFLIGFIAGIFFAQTMIIEKRLSDSVKLGAMVIYNKVYDLKERI